MVFMKDKLKHQQGSVRRRRNNRCVCKCVRAHTLAHTNMLVCLTYCLFLWRRGGVKFHVSLPSLSSICPSRFSNQSFINSHILPSLVRLPFVFPLVIFPLCYHISSLAPRHHDRHLPAKATVHNHQTHLCSTN